MSTYTPNYNLNKPDYSDDADISDINGNMDIIDTALKTIADGVSANTSNIGILSDTVGGLSTSVSNLSANKQDATDNNLSTSVKTVVGAINQLNSYKIAAVNLPTVSGSNYSTLMASLLNFYETQIGAIEVRFVRFVPSYYDNFFKGYSQVAICYKNGTGAYHTYLPTVGMSSYYYDGAWHWQQETRTNVNPS